MSGSVACQGLRISCWTVHVTFNIVEASVIARRREQGCTVTAHRIAMLGTGLIGDFYTAALHHGRNRDSVGLIYSRSEERGAGFQERWGVPRSTTSLEAACSDPETDTVVIGLPNNMHEEAVRLAAENGKNVLCTKPLGRTATEARRMLDTVERHGVFAGYLEDLVYTPKSLAAVKSVSEGTLGDIFWV